MLHDVLPLLKVSVVPLPADLVFAPTPAHRGFADEPAPPSPPVRRGAARNRRRVRLTSRIRHARAHASACRRVPPRDGAYDMARERAYVGPFDRICLGLRGVWRPRNYRPERSSGHSLADLQATRIGCAALTRRRQTSITRLTDRIGKILATIGGNLRKVRARFCENAEGASAPFSL